MSHHLTTSHGLPAEIHELFIDALSADHTPRARRALRQCALVSHAFRNRAHHHLFSQLAFVQPPYSTPANILSRLFKFRGLIESGRQLPTLTMPLYHTRAFKLVMDGSLFEAYAILENEDLVCILQLLQEHSWNIGKVSLKGSSFPIVWPDLTWKFRAAFRQLCRASPGLTTLCLENMTGVPHTLLLGTNIRHVRFHLIEFAMSSLDFLPRFRYNHAVEPQLESIDIDYTFPFPTEKSLLSSAADEVSLGQYQSIFAGVQRLRYLIYRSDDMERFLGVAHALAASLTSVDLELANADGGFLRALTWALPLDALPHLRRLRLRHRSLVAVGTRHPLVKVGAMLRNMRVPAVSLRKVELVFDVRADPPWVKRGHFFPEPGSWTVMDAALMHEKFKGVEEVLVRLRYFTMPAPPWAFSEAVFLERCRRSVESVFPLLYASSKKVHMDISVLPVFGENERLAFDS